MPAANRLPTARAVARRALSCAAGAERSARVCNLAARHTRVAEPHECRARTLAAPSARPLLRSGRHGRQACPPPGGSRGGQGGVGAPGRNCRWNHGSSRPRRLARKPAHRPRRRPAGHAQGDWGNARARSVRAACRGTPPCPSRSGAGWIGSPPRRNRHCPLGELPLLRPPPHRLPEPVSPLLLLPFPRFPRHPHPPWRALVAGRAWGGWGGAAVRLPEGPERARGMRRLALLLECRRPAWQWPLWSWNTAWSRHSAQARASCPAPRLPSPLRPRP